MAKKWIGLTASAAMLGLLPGALNSATLRGGLAAQKRAGELLVGAREALARGTPAAAVRQAEAAVALAPRDAQARWLLGRAYLAAGRFQSAETALGDALTLDPSLARASVGRALAQIALGRIQAAQASLDAARDSGVDADIGLALALLGRTDEARERLLAAARAPGADARTRQNLALVYAFEGRWNDAAAVAAQDVPPELIADRLRRWTMVAQMKGNPAMQVGALLGVLPAADGGLPAELALAVPPAPVAEPMAEPAALAEITPPPAPALLAPADPVAPIMQISNGETVTRIAFVPPPLQDLVALPAWTPPASEAALVPLFAAAEAPRPAGAWAGPPRPAAAPPKPVLLVSRTELKPMPGAGGWSVQFGAFSAPARTELAWSRLNMRVTFLRSHVPTGSRVKRGKALFHRLSVGGLSSRAEAIRLCLKVRAAGAPCFVRQTSGDRPLQWTLRNRSNEPA